MQQSKEKQSGDYNLSQDLEMFIVNRKKHHSLYTILRTHGSHQILFTLFIVVNKIISINRI